MGHLEESHNSNLGIPRAEDLAKSNLPSADLTCVFPGMILCELPNGDKLIRFDVASAGGIFASRGKMNEALGAALRRAVNETPSEKQVHIDLTNVPTITEEGAGAILWAVVGKGREENGVVVCLWGLNDGNFEKLSCYKINLLRGKLLFDRLPPPMVAAKQEI